MHADPADAFVTAPGQQLALVGLDRFEHLRLQLGPERTGRVLSEVRRRMAAVLPAARLGRVGRNTVELLFSSPAPFEVLTQLHGELERPFNDADGVVELAVSVGFAAARDDEDLETILEHAGAALTRARTGQARVAEYTSDDRRLASDRLALMRDLRSAIARDQLHLVYQPKLRAKTGAVESVEALMRWRHPERGLVPPDQFIGLAEETGDISALTRWVILRAIADRATLAAAGRPLEVHVNVSGALLADEAFAAWALAAVGSQAEGVLGFEITETAVIADPERALRHLQAFVEAGIRISIDDYGSGLSSLAYLKQLPAHELKIDRLFIAGLCSSHRDPLIVRSTIDLAHALEMEVTAEGVDDPATLALLRVMGCDLIQGYLVARPLPLPELLDFLAGDAASALAPTNMAKLLFTKSAAAA